MIMTVKILAPGERVTLDDPDFGPYHGRVVVCLCKRHAWQPYLQGRECGHSQCGFRVSAADCPWPLHVIWDDGSESHQGTEDLATLGGPVTSWAGRDDGCGQ